MCFDVDMIVDSAFSPNIFFLGKYNTYVKVVLQNVSMETGLEKGNLPSWEEEFLL